MGRRFTAASDERIFVGSTGLAGFNFTFGTAAAVVNFVSITPAGTIFATNNQSGASVTLYTSNSPSNLLHLYDGTSDRTGTAIATGITYVLGFTKATGTATGRTHLYNASTNAWTHTALSGTNVNGANVTSLSIGTFQDNTAADPIDADIFALGLWQGYAMSDAEFERLAKGRWPDHGPDFYEQFTDRLEVGDMMTTIGRYRVKQTTRTGTTRGTTKPPAGFRFVVNRRRR